MSDTPRTDAAIESDRINFEMSREFCDPHYTESGLADFARQLERELDSTKLLAIKACLALHGRCRTAEECQLVAEAVELSKTIPVASPEECVCRP